MGLSSTLTSDLPPGSRLSTFPAASSASTQRGGGSRGSPVPGSGAAGLSSVPEHDGASAAAAAMAAGPGELPPVDDLLAKVSVGSSVALAVFGGGPRSKARRTPPLGVGV